MAILVANQSGNFTSASTWSVVEPTTFTTVRNTQEYGFTGTSTSFVASATFTLASNTSCDGIMLKYGQRSGSSVVTVRIYNVTSGAVVTNASVTFNSAVLSGASASSTATMSGNWMFFKFPAVATLPASHTLRVEISSTVANDVYFYRKTGTAGNWTFGLRTTSTAAPAAGDLMLIMAQSTGNYNFSAYTVTMNNTATTQFGNAATLTSAIEVSSECSLQFGTSVSTNYYLKLAGNLSINEGANLIVGTETVPIPATSTATIEFVNATTNGKYGIIHKNSLENYSSWVSNISLVGEDTRSLGYAFLSNNASIGDTTLSVTTSGDINGWKTGDYIVIPPTSRTVTQAENRTLSVDSSGTTLTLNSGLTYAHDAYIDPNNLKNTPILNFTRNIKVLGTSAAYNSYLETGGWAHTTITNVEFQYMGGPGITLLSKGAVVQINKCSFRQAENSSSSVGIKTSSVIGEHQYISISNCVFYRIGTNAIEMYGNSQDSDNLVNNVYCVGTGATASNKTSILINASKGTYSNLYGSGLGAPFSLTVDASNWLPTYSNFLFSYFNFNNAYINSSVSGININAQIYPYYNSEHSMVFENIYALRSGSNTTGYGYGLNLTGSSIMFKNCNFSENIKNNIQMSGCTKISFWGSYINETTTYTVPTCILVDNSTDIKFVNSTVNATTTLINSITANTVQDIDIALLGGTVNLPITVIPTQVTNFLSGKSKIAFSKCISGNTGIYRVYKPGGYIESSPSAYVDTAPGTYYLIDDTSKRFLTSEVKWVPVPAGKKVSISVYVKRNTTPESSFYNPELLQIAPYENDITNYDNSLIKTIAPYTSYSMSTGVWTKISGSSEVANVDTVFGFFLAFKNVASNFHVDKWEVYYE
jgi:hypothetical protein